MEYYRHFRGSDTATSSYDDNNFGINVVFPNHFRHRISKFCGLQQMQHAGNLCLTKDIYVKGHFDNIDETSSPSFATPQ